MKNFKLFWTFMAVFALIFTSCSKDEEPASSSEKAVLSFGAVLADANKNTTKQSSAKQFDTGDLPACSEDVPDYVEIILLQGETEIVGTADEPYRVDLVDGQVFTEDDPNLELDPGTYTLEYFAVYNSEGELLWLAPKGGVLSQFVENALPMDINLGAGVKKYVDVSVLCFDDRNVNEYGYQFFELDVTEVFEYCFFANYCAPDGRHYPARYAVSVSIDGGELLYSNVVNTTGVNEDGDNYAEALCIPLPDLPEYADDEEYLDVTVTLLDWEGVYEAPDHFSISGSLSRNEITRNFVGEDGIDFNHLRFGCE